MKRALFALLCATSLSAPVLADQALATSKNCMACHALDRKLVGPSYKDVAAKYASDKSAVDKLAGKIQKGGAGTWSPVPMPANTQVNDAEAHKLAAWVLTVKNAQRIFQAMTTIRQEDLIESVAAALQYISYYHPADYIAHLARAYEREQSPAAKDAIAQILTNSKMSATGHRPICQDTGIVNVFLKIGMDVRWEGFSGSVDDAVNEGVRRGYNHPDNMLRASVVADPQFDRKNTKDNTPAVIFSEIVPGNTLEITVAAKLGQPDPAFNPRLRAAILEARAENMPKDNIERAIKKASGSEAESYDDMRYEGYGPGGVAVIVEALTDNHNRTASEVRSAFTKAGGNLGTTGSVAFMFDHVGVVEYDAKVADADAMLEAAIEAGAEDVTSDENGHQIFTTTETLRDVAKALEAKYGEARKAAMIWKPQNTVMLSDEAGEKMMKLMQALDDDDDVQNVFANFEVSDALMQKMGE